MRFILLLFMLLGCSEKPTNSYHITKYEWDSKAIRCENICNVLKCTNTRGYGFIALMYNNNTHTCSCSCRIKNTVWGKQIEYY